MAKFNYQKMPMRSERNNYYIHLHAENVGKIRGRKVNENSIARVFTNQKNKAREASINIYKTLLHQNIVTIDSMEGLELALETGNRDFINKLNDAMKEHLDAIIDREKIDDLSEYYNEAYQTADTLLEESKRGLAALNTFIGNVNNALRLLETPEANRLGALLVDATRTRGLSLKKGPQGKALTAAINKFKAEHNFEVFTIHDGALQNIIKHLEVLATDLQTKKTLGGKDLTVAGLRRLMINLFTKGFSESLIGLMSAMADEVAYKIGEVVFSGDKQHVVVQYDPQGKARQRISAKRKKVTGKKDVSLSNVRLAIDSAIAEGAESGELSINLGVSVKFHQNKIGTKSVKNASFSSGSGGTLKEAFYSLFGTDVVKNYYAYNVISHGSEMSEAVKALQDIILTRQINRLFATTGSAEDFNQLIFANNKVITVWDLVNYVSENTVGLSSSMVKGNTFNQALTLTIPDRKNIEMQAHKEEATDQHGIHNQYRSAWLRSHFTNQLINSATFSAYLHINNLQRVM